MLEDSILRSGNLNTANSVEGYQKAYEQSLAKDGHFEAAPGYYVDASEFWTNYLSKNPMTFRESKMHLDRGTGEVHIVSQN